MCGGLGNVEGCVEGWAVCVEGCVEGRLMLTGVLMAGQH